MTLLNAVKAKLDFINCFASEDFLVILFTELDIEPEQEFSAGNKKELDSILYNVIPLILAKPNSISEGDFSIKYDKESLLEFLNFICFKNGFSNPFLDNQIIDKSNIW